MTEVVSDGDYVKENFARRVCNHFSLNRLKHVKNTKKYCGKIFPT